jgi:7-cyano-7-deazaguanine reductase
MQLLRMEGVIMFFDNVVLLDDAVNGKKLPALETFDCPYDAAQGAQGVIRIVFPEFTCVCPKTGYPDFASIGIWYLPDRLCIELKSWKLYLNAFRMVGTFHETVTHHLFTTLEKVLKPSWLLVAGDFFPRGNVDTTVVFESPGPRPRGADLLLAPLRPRCRGFDE